MGNNPFLLRFCLSACSLAANVIAAQHYLLVQSKIVEAPTWLNAYGKGNFAKLGKVWYARIVRRFISVAVRSLFRETVLKMVEMNICLPENTGCVIGVCHTPWKRLLVQWCLERKNILIIANGNWVKKRRQVQIRSTGFRELKKAITHLRQNGQVVIALDGFNQSGNCQVSFQGNACSASIFPLRLSRLGKVPLIMAIPVFTNGTVHFIEGPGFMPQLSKSDSYSAMQCLISRLDNEINNDPSIWPEFVK